MCIVIDKFFGGGSADGADGAIEEMLDGLVAEESRGQCAEKIAEAAEEVKGNELKNKIAEIIKTYGGSATELECAMIAEAAEKLCGNAIAETEGDSAAEQAEESQSGE